jgi:type II secretory pathway component PulF
MRAIGLIHYAEHVGRLSPTIDRLLKEMVGESRKIQEVRAFAYWYPPVLLLIGGGCIGLMGLFVFPKLQQIFQDFHVPLSPITGWVIWSWNVIMPAAPILLLLVLLACAIRLRESVRIRPSTWLFRGMRDRILWLLPLAHSLVRDRDMTDICSVLADSVELGYPLDEALLRAQQLDLNLIMRRRLERWADAVGSGSLPGDAARQARMPGFLAGMLGTGQEAPDLGEVLRFVSRFYASRFMRVRELLRGAYLPLVTLIMGLLVAAVALALFVPMQQLIEDVLGPRRSF